MTNWGEICKGPFLTAFRCYLVVFPERLRDTTKTLSIAGVPSEIRKEYFPNASHNRFFLNQLARYASQNKVSR